MLVGEEELLALLDSQPNLVCSFLPDTTLTFLNAAYARYLDSMSGDGGRREDYVGLRFIDTVPEDEAPRVRAFLASFSPEKPTQTYLRQGKREDGSDLAYEWVVDAVFDASGAVIGFRGTGRDLTGKVRAEQELRESEEQFRQMAENIEEVFWLFDPDENRTIYVSPAYDKIWGRSREVLYGNSDTFLDALHPDDKSRVVETFRERSRSGFDIEYRILRPDGSVRRIWDRAFPVRDKNGRVHRIAGIAQDITKRFQAESAVRESEARFRAQFKNLPIPTYCWRKQGDDFVLIDHNDAAMAFTDGLIGDFLGTSATEFFRNVPEQVDWMREAFAGGVPVTRETWYTMRTTGERKFGAVTMTRVPPDQVMVHTADSTGRKQEEEQLRQAQKMDAIGQLTGGVAHEFNNLLAVIMGNLDFLREDLDPSTKQARYATLALNAAQRGATLTQRLLSFSRQQPLEPKSVDLNALVTRMGEMLRPVLSASIEVESSLAADLRPALVDAAQLESVIVTLAVNAQDAMPGGGALTIRTANVRVDTNHPTARKGLTPGPYVLLTVSDVGSGMPPEVAERAFDPFFTTKEVGKGTGLGLSMVHGFVMQTGGHVEIESEVGRGTTLRIFLPCADAAPVETTPDPETLAEHCGSGETILVVEDDNGVRDLAVELLSSIGYITVEACDGKSALGILDRTPDVHLLFTDIVLPSGMSGIEMAAQARRMRPDLKVLFTTGYIDGSVAGHGDFAGGAELIDKPYRKAVLAEKIAGVLRA